MKEYFWKFDWIVDILNEKWFTHFYNGKNNDCDFKKWIWFFIDLEKKQYWKAFITDKTELKNEKEVNSFINSLTN